MRVKSGLTTVEVLFSLVALTIFLMASFQLYGVVMESTLAARSQSKAANIAYNHLRHVGNAFIMSNCPKGEIVKEEIAFKDEELPGLRITSKITAPYGCESKLIRINLSVDYTVNGSHRNETQVLYVQK